MNDRENTLHCKCSNDVRNIIHRSFFLSAPPVLGIVIDRVQNGGSLNHVPVQITRELNVKHLFAGNIDAKRVDYQLIGLVKHHGLRSSEGHYNSLLFDNKDMAVNFDDTNLKQYSASNCLKSLEVQKYSRILFYIRKSVVAEGSLSGRDIASLLDLSLIDLIGVEERWFGLFSGYLDSVERQEDRRLAVDSELTGDLIYSCLKHLAVVVPGSSKDANDKTSNISHGDHSLEFANVWSNNIFTDIREGRDSRLLNIAVQESRLFLENSDVILMPVHQKDRNHWSVVGIYPKVKVIVHCDSMRSDDADKIVFEIVAKLLSKCFSFLGRKLSKKSWKVVPLHNYGLQQQSDGYNCGVFACLFAYSLLTFKDIPVTKMQMKIVRYWISKHANLGKEIGTKVRCHNSTLWQNIPGDTPVFPIHPTFPTCNVNAVFRTLQKSLFQNGSG